MPHASERRTAPRVQAELESYFSSAREEGRAILANFSSSGALLAQTASRPRVGARVRLSVFLQDHAVPLHVVGHIARCTEDGFAIVYENPYPEIYDLLGAAPNAPAIRGSDSGQARAPARARAARPEAGPEPVRETLESILELAVGARRGAIEPTIVLAVIADRVREALEHLDDD